MEQQSAVPADIARILSNLRSIADVCPASLQSRIEDATYSIECLSRAYFTGHDDIWDGLKIRPLTRRLARVLHANLGKIVNRSAILDALYFEGADDMPYYKIIDVVVCELRRHLRETPYRVETVWGTGYKMVDAKAEETV